MRPLNLLFAAMLLALAACQTRRVQDGERALFPAPGASKWWIMSGLLPGPDGMRHVPLLLTCDPAAEGAAGVLYAAQWQGAYAWGLLSRSGVQVPAEPRFPLNFSFPGDSLRRGGRVLLDRRSWWMDADLRGPAGPVQVALRARLPRVGMRMEPFAEAGGVYLAGKLPVQERGQAAGSLAVLSLENGAALQEMGAQGPVIFLHLELPGDVRVILLAHQPQGQDLQVLASEVRGGHQVTGQGAALLLPDAGQDCCWTSTASGKTYPLHFRLRLQEGGEWRLHPCAETQEFPMKRSSFWMGGVRMENEAGEQAAGNMYIFRK